MRPYLGADGLWAGQGRGEGKEPATEPGCGQPVGKIEHVEVRPEKGATTMSGATFARNAAVTCWNRAKTQATGGGRISGSICPAARSTASTRLPDASNAACGASRDGPDFGPRRPDRHPALPVPNTFRLSGRGRPVAWLDLGVKPLILVLPKRVSACACRAKGAPG